MEVKASPSMFFGSILILFLISIVYATNPPDHITQKDCYSVGPATLCAINQSTGKVARLFVEYTKGYLSTSANLSAWVQLNGKSGLFELSKDNSVTLGALRNVHFCYHGAIDEPSDFLPGSLSGYPRCPFPNEDYPLQEPGKGFVGWWADKPSYAEQNLFFYAYNNGKANAWDVQVAFVDGLGRWDSNMGKNYKFRFLSK